MFVQFPFSRASIKCRCLIHVNPVSVFVEDKKYQFRITKDIDPKWTKSIDACSSAAKGTSSLTGYFATTMRYVLSSWLQSCPCSLLDCAAMLSLSIWVIRNCISFWQRQHNWQKLTIGSLAGLTHSEILQLFAAGWLRRWPNCPRASCLQRSCPIARRQPWQELPRGTAHAACSSL